MKTPYRSSGMPVLLRLYLLYLNPYTTKLLLCQMSANANMALIQIGPSMLILGSTNTLNQIQSE
jgi:hypothetical protein